VASSWLSKVAHHLRQKGLDTSTANIIESVRMAETLAALRDKSLPDLQELNEAVLSTFCFGDDTSLRLIHDELIVGDCLGEVPDNTPTVPLQQDLTRLQKRLRLKPSSDHTDIELDLREASGLERSQLLHRLLLLDMPWGTKRHAGVSKGTFKEAWRLQWQPEFAIRLIEASIWGVTIEEVATRIAKHQVEKTEQLDTLTELVNKILLADLTAALDTAMQKLQAEAAVTSDVAQLMDGLPPLVKTLQYSQQGVVKRFDSTMVAQVVDAFIVRICVGLVNACSSLDDNAANEMSERLIRTKEALFSLNKTDYIALWHETLLKLLHCQTLHSLMSGRCCRLLLDSQTLTLEHVAQHMIFALSAEPLYASAWLEGFLRGKAEILLHDDSLWNLLDNWVCELKAETCTEILPLLRRTFATFGTHQRRQMGERVKNRQASTPIAAHHKQDNFDEDTALKALPLIATLLGLSE
jgi:flagellar biosynthesis/type III secretory pathway chaperone